MKTKKTILLASIVALFSMIAFHSIASTLHEETAVFKVYGNCEMCKSRIENSLKINGVSKANWDVKTKMLTVTYNPHIVALDDIHKKVAEVGHDTEKTTSSDKTYKNLAGCCQYNRKK